MYMKMCKVVVAQGNDKHLWFRSYLVVIDSIRGNYRWGDNNKLKRLTIYPPLLETCFMNMLQDYHGQCVHSWNTRSWLSHAPTNPKFCWIRSFNSQFIYGWDLEITLGTLSLLTKLNHAVPRYLHNGVLLIGGELHALWPHVEKSLYPEVHGLLINVQQVGNQQRLRWLVDTRVALAAAARRPSADTRANNICLSTSLVSGSCGWTVWCRVYNA